jgi:hypothetical protein
MAYLKYSELCIRTTLTFTIHYKLRITILNIRNILSFLFNELIVKVYKNVLQFHKMTSFEKKSVGNFVKFVCVSTRLCQRDSWEQKARQFALG